jgi:hypothetical protein
VALQFAGHDLSGLPQGGLAMEEACLHPERNAAPVATPSAAQVREPIHGRGSGRWRPYASHLDVLRGAVLDMA